MSKFTKAIIGLTILIVTFYGGILLYFYLNQDELIYYPTQDIDRTPQSIGLEYSNIEIDTPDGVRLHGWFTPCDSARGIIILFHGNAGNISNRVSSVEIYHQMQFASIVFDYRGYGKSSSKPSEEGLYSDAEAVYRYVIDSLNFDKSKIIFHGRSLGGAVAIHSTMKFQPKLLIVESTFTSIRDLGKDLYPYLPIGLLSRSKFHSFDKISNIHCPILLIHSRDDELINYSHAEKLFARADHPKEILTIDGTHNDGARDNPEIYQKGLSDFIDKYFE